MTSKPLDLTPEQAAWGAFYAQLHSSAQRLRQLMQTADSACCPGVTESAASTAQTEAAQPAYGTRKRRAGQNRGDV